MSIGERISRTDFRLWASQMRSRDAGTPRGVKVADSRSGLGGHSPAVASKEV